MTTSSNSYHALLKLCSDAQNQNLAKKIHSHIIRTFTRPETFLLNNVIGTYAKVGNLEYARRVFDQMSHPNPFSWNTILSAYSKSGHLSEMQLIFDRMPSQDGVSWNSLISGYASYGSLIQSVTVYKLMMKNGAVNLNRITFSTMLTLSSNQGSVYLGRQIHGQVIKFGFNSYVFVMSPLVDMYSKLGLVYDAKRVFDETPERNVVMYNTMITGLWRSGMIEDSRRLFWGMKERDSVSWTTMIKGLMQNGLGREAIEFLREMRLGGFDMDQYTFGTVLTACGDLFALEEEA